MTCRLASKTFHALIVSALAIGACTVPACAQDAPAPGTQSAVAEPQLGVGNPVPAFTGKMIKGDQVTAWEPGVVYVLEFWATWCLPCKAAIPHINELHNQYKDKGVIFIGQAVFEQDAESAPKFVAEQGDAMAYRVALDVEETGQADTAGMMARTWLHSAGIRSIPSTWIVKDGKILWIGHPKDLDTLKIDAAKAGTFDILAAKKEVDAKTKAQRDSQERQTRYWDALHDKDEAAANAAIAELEAANPTRPEVGMAYRTRALVRFGHYAEAIDMAKKQAATGKDPKQVFSRSVQGIQDLIVTNPRDKAFLADVRALLDAVTIPETDNPEGAEAVKLKLSAWISCLEGDNAAAVKQQEKVVEAFAKSPLLPLETKALEGYKLGKPPALIPKRSKKAAATQPATQP